MVFLFFVFLFVFFFLVGQAWGVQLYFRAKPCVQLY